MSAEKGLTWSGKWHIVNPHHPEANKYAIARCGAYLYRDDDPRYPDHLKRIKDGTKKSAGDCKLCNRSVGVKTATVELPDPTTTAPATDDENGVRSWDYPHGFIVVFDDGTIEWGSWHGIEPAQVRLAAAALLAAAAAAEVTS